MSFQTFCGKDPDDAVSYQKILPQFLPTNAPSASTIRITTTGSAVIPAPTIQNESLYVIDTAGINSTFTYNQIGIPAGYKNQGSPVPYVNPNDNTKIGYMMYAWKFDGDSPPTYRYAVLSWLNPQAGWTELFTTDQNRVINIISNVNPHYTDGGKPELADTFLIAGNFTQLGAVACASGYATYNPQNGTITPYAIGTPLPDPTELPYILTPIPAPFGGGFIGAFRNPANYNRIARLQGGAWSAIAPNTGMAATDKFGIEVITFDEPNGVLFVGGSFSSFNINGVAAPDSAGIVCIAWDNGTNDWRTNVPLPTIQPLYPYNSSISVQDIRLAYDPTQGFFVIGAFQNATATNGFFCKTIGSPVLPISVPATLVNLSGMAVIGIDQNNWVGTDYQRCFGIDAGGAVIEFGQGSNCGWNWYWNAPIATLPLSYWADICWGSFQAGVETTLDFTAANLRYCKSNGVSGLATSVVLTSSYASIFLIGDAEAQPPVWDMVSYTGLLTYNP